MGDYMTLRKGIYYLRRRIPLAVRRYDTREFVMISLKTSDAAEARRLLPVYNDTLEKFWRDLLASEGRVDEKAYAKAIALARMHGFVYKSAREISETTLREIIDRVAVASGQDAETTAAVLGGIDRPLLPLSECLDKYWPLCADRLVNKSPLQLRKWKVPREACLHNFIQVVGDKSLTAITREDVLAFRTWWLERVGKSGKEGRSADTANKQIARVRDILGTVALAENIDKDFDALFNKVALRNKSKSRPPFTATFVQDVLLVPATLSALNDEARHIVYALADTGARESELTGLLEEDIFLNTPIPYIFIRPRAEKMLKTVNAERQIPLVGAALIAFQHYPKGFERYRHTNTLSNTVNKFLRRNGILPSPDHSLYSLRHTFKDRLRDAGAPEEVIDELMGHEGSRPKYGRGHILETKLKWLQKIAYTVEKIS